MYQWPRQKSFAFGLCGEEAAHALARGWAYKGHYYYTIWELDFLQEPMAFTDDHNAAYDEEETFTEWAFSLTLEDEALMKVDELRRFVPRTP